jgi:hypothetical protein
MPVSGALPCASDSEQTETISALKIEPVAAYLLAAPPAPDEPKEAVVERAESGKRPGIFSTTPLTLCPSAL